MVTFIVVVALAAFIPYVAAPGIANGVKAVTSPPAAMRLDTSPPAAYDGTDAANRILVERRDSEASV
ncbi:hypothetical protein [Paraburkholderia lacunae]|uniref:Uncharacterized protein n=1 Tax=Paraburkholderia lacunae TaxID=2211104 RepID=A0A370ND58_9BURK|nr:hypothetical protein [Paraburkholderia lacunae]RDK03495.1 hypothetical protein DLM46_08220 [Paraburkholderia lacunae]